MVGKYFDGRLPEATDAGTAEAALADALNETVAVAESAMERLALHEAIGAVEGFVSAVNGYVTEQAPWKVAKSADDDAAAAARLATILYTAAEALRAVAVLHAATMPKTAVALWDALGAAEALGPLAQQRLGDSARWGQLVAGTTVTKGESLFPRIAAERA
jgi:methionyl-tRNA synthetase